MRCACVGAQRRSASGLEALLLLPGSCFRGDALGVKTRRSPDDERASREDQQLPGPCKSRKHAVTAGRARNCAALARARERMGIDGLLPFVSSALSDAHVSQFRGMAVAVDASGWLHRGAHACATELALGQATDKFLGFALRMVKMLQANGVTPVLVFDGGALPMKERTHIQRRKQREEAGYESWTKKATATFM